jgi:hypothetical protein
VTLVKARSRRFPEAAAAGAKEASVRVLASPVVLVEVMAVVPKPVRAILPEVPVMVCWPVVWTKPLDAVKVELEVMVPEPVVAIVPEVYRLPAVVTVNCALLPTPSKEPGEVLPMATWPVASIKNGVESVRVPSSLKRTTGPEPAVVTLRAAPELEV